MFQLLGHMLVVAEQVVTALGVSDTDEYRVIINNPLCPERANYQPQVHVLAGRRMGWPPG